MSRNHSTHRSGHVSAESEQLVAPSRALPGTHHRHDILFERWQVIIGLFHVLKYRNHLSTQRTPGRVLSIARIRNAEELLFPEYAFLENSRAFSSNFASLMKAQKLFLSITRVYNECIIIARV